MNLTPFDYFFDPVLRAPTIGCMLMCLSAALVGVIAFLRKQSLLGESLSHSAYPGVILGVIAAGMLSFDNGDAIEIPILIMVGAFISSLLGLRVIHYLERSLKIRADSALCFTLSAFFGIGLTLASHVQFTHSALYKTSLNYLYGQAATMTDIHIAIYGTLSFIVLTILFLFYKEIQAITFDRDYAKSIGIRVRMVDTLIFLLIVLAVVIGIRSVGVVLMSAMLIAPAAAARQFTHKLSMMLLLAALFGLLSGYLGNYLSVELTYYLQKEFPGHRLSLPTGPMIVIVAAGICTVSLLFAPERGIVSRLIRIGRFRYQCLGENLMKAMWRLGPDADFSFREITRFQAASKLYLRTLIRHLLKRGWIERTESNRYRLTQDGKHRAAHIVRLHRLWEVYLADYLGVGVERVHRSAEEMEHILTPELEEALTVLLHDPKYDPHRQPIPPKKEEL